MSVSFIQLNRQRVYIEKMCKSNKNAFILLTIIALRARRTDEENFDNLEIGEALIGGKKDCLEYGLTRQEFRTATLFLEKYKIITTKVTTKGTIAKLISDVVYNINPSTKVTTKSTKCQPPANHQPTTNNNDNKYNNDNIKETKVSTLKKIFSSKEISDKVYIDIFNRRVKLKQEELGKELTEENKENMHNYLDPLWEQFLSYWSEVSTGGKKMRCEKEKTFDINLRFNRWINNQK